VRCWHLRHWCCRSCCLSAMCICAGGRRARPPRPLIPLLSLTKIPLLSLTKIRKRQRQFRPTLTITARSARQFSWHRAHSRQRRRNCLSLRISSGSSIPSMSHDRSLGLRGSLSERALRPWRKAAVLLTSWLRSFRSLRRTTVQSNPAHFPRLNVPRFVAIGKATACLAFQKHCLVDYDVTGSLLRPLARGDAGRLSPAGAT
jgi:hypothetical protein